MNTLEEKIEIIKTRRDYYWQLFLKNEDLGEFDKADGYRELSIDYNDLIESMMDEYSIFPPVEGYEGIKFGEIPPKK